MNNLLILIYSLGTVSNYTDIIYKRYCILNQEDLQQSLYRIISSYKPYIHGSHINLWISGIYIKLYFHKLGDIHYIY